MLPDCFRFFVVVVLTRRGIEGGGVIVRHVVGESAVGRPFPVTVVSIINFCVVVVAVDVDAFLVFQILAAGFAAIHRRQTAANAQLIPIINNNNNQSVCVCVCVCVCAEHYTHTHTHTRAHIVAWGG